MREILVPRWYFKADILAIVCQHKAGASRPVRTNKEQFLLIESPYSFFLLSEQTVDQDGGGTTLFDCWGHWHSEFLISLYCCAFRILLRYGRSMPPAAPVLTFELFDDIQSRKQLATRHHPSFGLHSHLMKMQCRMCVSDVGWHVPQFVLLLFFSRILKSNEIGKGSPGL